MDMVKEIIQNEYTVNAQSFLRFLLNNWRLWVVFIAIVASFFYVGKNLYDDKYFGEKLVETYSKEVTIKQTRSTPNKSILVINPLDPTPFRLYEVDLGLNCILDKDVVGQKHTMQVELYKRNYNNSYYLKFPDIQNFVCVNKKSKIEDEAMDKENIQEPDLNNTAGIDKNESPRETSEETTEVSNDR